MPLSVRILGCRGSMPRSGDGYARFGGETTCFLLQCGEETLLVDGGTGILNLSPEQLPEKHASLLLTHTHSDHISGLPLAPILLSPGFRIDIYGAEREGLSVSEQLRQGFSPPLWPVGLTELPSKADFHDLPERLDLGRFIVESIAGDHPGGVSHLRIEAEGFRTVIMTDCTVRAENREALIRFASGADLLFIDGQYTDEEYAARPDFGHSSMTEAARLGLDAGCRRVCLVHHDPFRTDTELAECAGGLRERLMTEFGFSQERVDDVCFGFSGQSFRAEAAAERPPYRLTQEQTDGLLATTLSLASRHDREELLSVILDTAMDLTSCDAGTLYLLEEDGLHFSRMVTRSMGVRQGGHADPISLPPVPLEPHYICSRAALERTSFNVAQVQTDSRFDFSGSRRYDEMTGYRTVSMLVVPMENDGGVIIGVLQLINAKNRSGETVSFDPGLQLLTEAMAANAAAVYTNMQYRTQIDELLDSLTGALSAAIDERSPYNANHTRNMVRVGTAFLDRTAGLPGVPEFDSSRRRAFLLSVWLHDVGKLTVPLEVMDKESRLGTALTAIEERWSRMDLLERLTPPENESAEARRRRREEGLELIRSCNTAGYLTDDRLAALSALAGETYRDTDGSVHPWLTAWELNALSVRKGTLTPEERRVMESHVTITARILSHVRFPKELSEAPVWAAMHHEFLNGRGYPKGLRGDEIPWEVRLLTILDVFDALTARDRPYKPAIPTERALNILESMAEEGSLDGDVVALFRRSKAWEVIQ